MVKQNLHSQVPATVDLPVISPLEARFRPIGSEPEGSPQ